ncbi:MAG: aldehyde dehydrogenase [Acidocella sp. 20-63-7]|nr:MAG: aldehyde dehydrogenase [Acidocella sp. 20-63-7]
MAITSNNELSAALSSHVKEGFYIGGSWVSSKGGTRHPLVSPVTGEPWVDVPLATFEDVDAAIDAARAAFDSGPWPRMAPAERAAALRRLAQAISEKAELFTALWAGQVGAPVGFGGMFSGFAPATLLYYADLAEQFTFSDDRKGPFGSALVEKTPVGVVAVVTPWNAPMQLMTFKLAPALATGCTCVIKSSPETPFDALCMAELTEAAGIPPGVINVLTADRDAGAHLVASPRIDKVSFTGSTPAGKAVGTAALQNMTRFTLELGGKSAAILMEDVDLSAALPSLIPFTMPFSGQICFAQTRILAPRSRLNEITQACAAVFKSLTVGEPFNPSTQLGPLSTKSQLNRVTSYIESGLSAGATLVTGGGRPSWADKGYWIEPTLFANVTSEMKIAQEEIFGPVICIMAYENDADAIRLANATEFGLSGSVFGQDTDRALAVARGMLTGHVGINGLSLMPGLPFGGYKRSGIGREGGIEGFESFLETKAIYGIPEVSAP